MSKKSTFLATVAVAALSAWQPVTAQETWQPTEPIQIIVPWSAGGATDAVMRVLAGEVSEALEVPVVVVNQTGARGTVGTKSVMDAPHDGLTWASGGVQDLGTYKVQGLLDTSIEDWEIFLVMRNAPVLSVGMETPFETPQDVANYMNENASGLTVGTSGIPSTAYSAMQAFQNTVGGEFRAVAYEGDAPTMVAVVSGEVQATTQSGPGQAAMIRGGRVKPLAVLADTSLEIEGVEPIPPITESFPEFSAPGVTIQAGIFVPADAPDEVIARLTEVWENEIVNSEALKNYASENGSIFTPVYGEEAMQMAKEAVAETAWRMHEDGTATVSPDEVGIPRP
ncbi:tripartite tricarboxylate transporter substrate binding protein [Fulvimarina sp. 2208YS6-2-32]|uniref:Tripartite tricarboxylate transporter substrate binding protein n=1 Tax=Fulvimarina uroteuthidis TaxID=3098149 RepID=A0ABU5I0J2_9HYPH|nr:tripartite tricarboxylate transporter substrate binding protein [Fulvimarina sp. 2208YS6-2-32]MDY8108731.1 tripartite tricarboxylate transporter substrate binding protein [Fulvimarina sp. 2208YS6-2-32]